MRVTTLRSYRAGKGLESTSPSSLSIVLNHCIDDPCFQILEKLQTAKRLFQGIPEEELRPRQEAWKEQRVRCQPRELQYFLAC